MTAPLVVTVERSGLVESTHLVDVAIVDATGATLASAGDPATIAFLRSTAKPVQALACLEAGWTPPGEDAVAIACGSHNGEPDHVALVRTILAAAGLDERALRCPPALPRVALGVDAQAPVFHNCSGKHAAMLATCVANGWPLDDYRAPDHPLQRAVATLVERLAGEDASAVGVDGCGVPTFAYRLHRAAAIAGRLSGAAPRVVEAMRAHPFLVAGTGRLCTAILSEVPDVVVKTGAEGIFVGTTIRDGTGFAVKARDGAVRAAEAAVVETLRFLEAIGEDPPSAVSPPPVTGGGDIVGAVRIQGEFARA